MTKLVTFVMFALVFCFALSLPVLAQQSIGGHDETTEDHTGAQWAAAAPATPKTGPALGGVHLLISEVGWRGTNSTTLSWADSTEFVEIYNPTSTTIDLSKYYLSDVNGYKALPVAGTIDVVLNATDFGMRFPAGATIAPGAYKVIAANGGWFKHFTGTDADYMLFPGAGIESDPTTAVLMVDVGTNKPVTYPTFGQFTNSAEFVWLFFWDGVSDLVCDADLVYWGSGTGANAPARKLTTDCQDGPDVDALLSCYNLDAGNPAGSMAKGLVAPASGAGTRQRTGGEGAETLTGGNGCVPGGPTAVTPSTWGQIKALYH